MSGYRSESEIWARLADACRQTKTYHLRIEDRTKPGIVDVILARGGGKRVTRWVELKWSYLGYRKGQLATALRLAAFGQVTYTLLGDEAGYLTVYDTAAVAAHKLDPDAVEMPDPEWSGRTMSVALEFMMGYRNGD